MIETQREGLKKVIRLADSLLADLKKIIAFLIF